MWPSTSASIPRHADQVVRGTVVLPHGTGKSVRVLVITQGDQVAGGRGRGRRFRGHRVHPEDQGRLARFDVIVATPDVMGQLGAARPRARSPGPDAEPQGRHGHHGRGRGRPRDQGRQDRVPGGQERQRARPGRARSRSARSSSLPTCRRSWTRSSGPSRRRPRASTSARPPSPAPWARAYGSRRRGTDEQDRAAGDGGEPDRAAQGLAQRSTSPTSPASTCSG